MAELEIQALQRNLDVLNRKIEFYKDQIKGDQGLSYIQMKSKSHQNIVLRLKGFLKMKIPLQPLLFKLHL